jgi:hypothetical protein
MAIITVLSSTAACDLAPVHLVKTRLIQCARSGETPLLLLGALNVNSAKDQKEHGFAFSKPIASCA